MRERHGQHPELDELGQLAAGRLDGATTAALEAHSSTCRRCADDLAWLRRVAATVRADPTEPAPDWVVSRAVRLMPARPDARPSLAGLKHVLATLLRDTAKGPATVGVRSATAGPRRLTYHSEAFDLDVRALRQQAGWVLNGQVLGDGAGGWAVLEGSAHAETPLSAELEFRIANIPPGTYRLRVIVDQVLVETPELDLGAG